MITPQQSQAVQAILKQANYTPPAAPITTPTGQPVQTGNDMIQAKLAQLKATQTNPVVPTGSPESQVIGDASDLAASTNSHAANIVQDLSQKPSFTGATDVLGNVAGETGDIIGGLTKFAAQATMPKPVYDFVSNLLSKGIQAVAGSNAGQNISDAWGQLSAKYPDATKNVANLLGISAIGIGADEAPTISETGNAIKTGASTAADMVTAPFTSGASSASDAATNEAIGNIAKQEGGIVAPAKTASQFDAESQQKTWDVIKPKLSPGEMNDAAAAGKIGRTGETGVVTQIPTKSDIADIKLAQPYVDAANGDPIKTVANIKQGIADEATKLRAGVGTQGGTFSTSNVKGAINDVKIPLAIKDSAEMTQVNNIKDYVAELAKGVDKNPTGALDLSQKFRQGINSEFGENVWGKGTPISNYIKSVNKALNDFISTRLPEGTLPDGSLIKDSFAKQSQLYDIMDNIQLPKLGEASINPTEETPLKVPGSPLSEASKAFGKAHPIIKGVAKGAAKIAGLGTAVKLGEL